MSSTKNTPLETRLQDVGGQSLQEQIVVRVVQFPVIFAPKTSYFLVGVTVLVLQPNTKVT